MGEERTITTGSLTLRGADSEGLGGLIQRLGGEDRRVESEKRYIVECLYVVVRRVVGGESGLSGPRGGSGRE